MKYRIVHETRYAYAKPVVLCHNEARLQPRPMPFQRCEHSEVRVEPPPAQQGEREDFFGNRVLYFAVQDPHRQLVVTATSVVEVFPTRDEARSQAERDAEKREARYFTLASPFAGVSAEVAAWADASLPAGRPLVESVAALSSRIHDEFTFDPQITTVATPPSEVLAQRGGVCQDFAHLAIACLRSKGIPARYVSGYLETMAPPGTPRLRGSDASHAWFAAFLPEIGWVDFDPTTDISPAERHVTTAWGRDYGDVAPLKGVIFGGGTHSPEVSVDMIRIEEPGTCT